MLTIPTEYIRATKLTHAEILLEIAVMLFQKEKLTLGQAAGLADLPQYKFQLVLSDRNISIHYDTEEYLEDLQTLKSLRL